MAGREGLTSYWIEPMQPTERTKTSPQDALALLDEAWAYYTPANAKAPAWKDEAQPFDYADAA